jgi:hypothetical protein
VRSHQLALGAFNGIARFGFVLKFLGPLFLASGLQSGVVLTYHDRAMLLVFAQALLA